MHVESDHPPIILKQLPIAVEKRLSDLSANEQIFENAKGHYQDALEKSGFNHQLKYNPTVTVNPANSGANRRKRGRKVIWFNPLLAGLSLLMWVSSSLDCLTYIPQGTTSLIKSSIEIQ